MSVACRIAERTDHQALAAFLRQPMSNTWSIGYDLPSGLEPACSAMGERWQAAIVRHANGHIDGCGFRFVQPVVLHGRPTRLGYLGWMRRSPDAAPSLTATRTRACMAALVATRTADELPWDLTAIMADNRPARRLLERGLPGLPRYHRLGNFRTALFACSAYAGAGSPRVEERAGDDPECIQLVLTSWRHHGLAPQTVCADRFWCLSANGGLVACLGLRDDRQRRGLILAAMPRTVQRWRHAVNLGRRWSGLPSVPAAGTPLATLSVVGCVADDAVALRPLLGAAARYASQQEATGLLAGAWEGSALDTALTAVGPAHRERACWYAVGEDPPALASAHQEVSQL